MNRKSLLVSIGLSVILVSPAVADSYGDYGMQLYKAGNYKNAAMYFAQSLRANPNNPSALYYSALCCLQMGNIEAANNGFHTVVQVFPNSPEAALARQQLGKPAASAARRPAVTKGVTAQPAAHVGGVAHGKPHAAVKHGKK